MRSLKIACAAVVCSSFVGTIAPTAAHAHSKTSCAPIRAELIQQGASNGVADWFAYRIAWRESGCRAAYVRDHDDWSHSRFGLNGRTRNLRTFWRNVCGADVRYDTRVLSIDVRCALAAYNTLGTRPWR
jgi:hypothetical protein